MQQFDRNTMRETGSETRRQSKTHPLWGKTAFAFLHNFTAHSGLSSTDFHFSGRLSVGPISDDLDDLDFLCRFRIAVSLQLSNRGSERSSA